jgi:subtilisin family serine protease
MKLWYSPWPPHGRQDSLRRKSGAAQTRLSLETLEDRLALSTFSTGPISYTAWRSQTFSIEQTAVANPPSAPQLQANDAGQGEGFGQDINLPQVVANYPFRGHGYSVAVIDTGIDYNNPALGGGWGRRVITGYNFVNNTSDPMDDNGHGTHVAGIIGSSDATYTGIVPDVNFVALKVLDASGSGSFGAVDQALQWVAAHQAQYNIVAVNLSLGAGNYATNPYTFLESDFAALKSEGVFIASASGNSYYTYGSQQGLAYPAISPQVVSVGAVWDGDFGAVSWVSGARDNATAPDHIASFTQRSSGLDILAPGAMITSTYLHNTFQQMAGTSMATPVVAGAAALLHQALDAGGDHAHANEDSILSLMRNTGLTVIDGAHENDNVVHTGLAFKRLDLYAALQSVHPVTSAPPTLAAIPDQTMTAGVPRVVNLTASDPGGLAITFSGRVTGNGSSPAYQLGQSLGLAYAGSYFQNSMGQNEKWVLGRSSQWYCLLPNGDLRRWMGNPGDTMAAAALVASPGPAVYANPALLWTPPTAPGVTLTFSGNQLTVGSDPNFLGSFTVTVTASDGIASASRSFTVNVNNRPPVLGAIANQTMVHSQRALTVNLAASDPDNDPLTLSARVVPPSPQAYNLRQALGLSYTGNYWTNWYGLQEKWLRGATSGTWYCLLPSGELRLAGNSASSMLAAGSLIASLDSSFHQDPSLLWSAQAPVTPPVTFTFSGTSRMVVAPALSVVGSFVVEVTLSDGQVSVKQSFTFTVTNYPPTLAPVADRTMTHGTSLVVTLNAADADNDLLALSGQTVTPSQRALALEQALGLIYTGNYWTNYYGQGEKWLRAGTTGPWYCVLPGGDVRRAGASAAAMLSAGSLVDTLGANYWLDPSLLYNAQHYAAPQVSYAVSGYQLSITPPATFVGTFLVQAGAYDGAASATQTFAVTVTDTAPVLGALANQAMSHTQGSLTLPLSASAADGAPLTFAAQALSTSQVAFSLKQSLGFMATANYWTNFWGASEKWLQDRTGVWYCLLASGELRRAGGSVQEMQSAAALVATLDSSFYQDPSLLWNAQPGAAAPVTLRVTGSQLTIQPAASFVGTFTVQVNVSDGIATTRGWFTVSVR